MAAQFRITAQKVPLPSSVPVSLMGESPSWDDCAGVLWWADILGGRLVAARPCADGMLGFDRAAVVPLPGGHQPGFVLHSDASVDADTLPGQSAVYYTTLSGAPLPDTTTAADASALAAIHYREDHARSRHVLFFGSEKGLFAVSLPLGLPWVATMAGPAGRAGPLPAASQARLAAMRLHKLSDFPTPAEESAAADAAAAVPSYRFNDAKVGPDGVVYCGVLRERTAAFPTRPAHSGALVRVQLTPAAAAANAAKDGKGVAQSHVTTDVALPGTTVSNGMGWSPCGRRFFHVDSARRCIDVYHYHQGDSATALSPRRSGLEVESRCCWWSLDSYQRQLPKGAALDGLCVDEAGDVWVAVAGAGRVLRLSSRASAGEDEERVEVTGVVYVPGVSLVTSCCFGGPGRQTLFITTARGTSLAQAQRCAEPDAGYVFAVMLEGIARGVATSRVPMRAVFGPAAAPLIPTRSHL